MAVRLEGTPRNPTSTLVYYKAAGDFIPLVYSSKPAVNFSKQIFEAARKFSEMTPFGKSSVRNQNVMHQASYTGLRICLPCYFLPLLYLCHLFHLFSSFSFLLIFLSHFPFFAKFFFTLQSHSLITSS
jgi:hypothetical protein